MSESRVRFSEKLFAKHGEEGAIEFARERLGRAIIRESTKLRRFWRGVLADVRRIR